MTSITLMAGGVIHSTTLKTDIKTMVEKIAKAIEEDMTSLVGKPDVYW